MRASAKSTLDVNTGIAASGLISSEARNENNEAPLYPSRHHGDAINKQSINKPLSTHGSGIARGARAAG